MLNDVENVTINDNNISSNNYGIYADSSDIIYITNNNITSNHETGIFLNYDKNIIINDNKMLNNGGGISAIYSTLLLIRSNVLENNLELAIYLNNDINNEITWNSTNILNNSYMGRVSYYTGIFNNIIKNNKASIEIDSFNHTYIAFNIINSNEGSGINVYLSNLINIASNNITDNVGDGVFASESDVSVGSNNISRNGGFGVNIIDSLGSVIWSNLIIGNSEGGVLLLGCDDAWLRYNNVTSNFGSGVFVSGSKNLTIDIIGC